MLFQLTVADFTPNAAWAEILRQYVIVGLLLHYRILTPPQVQIWRADKQSSRQIAVNEFPPALSRDSRDE